MLKRLTRRLREPYVSLMALSGPSSALVLASFSPGEPAAVVLPLDALFEERVLMARRLLRALVRRAKLTPAGLTLQRRRRLKLVLRALDADLDGEDYRAIAAGLFGGRVPTDAAWRTHSVRSLTIRLVHDGRALMHGGYLKLLRPERRDP